MSPFDDDEGAGGALQQSAAYEALSQIAVADLPLERVLEEVAALASRVLLEAPTTSVTVVTGEWVRTAAFSGAVALQLDERQYEDGYGPCLDASVSGGVIEVTIDDTDPSYPDFRQAARRQGVTHSLSVGLPAAGRTIGALNLYSSSPQPFDPQSVRVADTFAAFAGLVLTTVGRDDDAAAAAAQLQSALRTRALINQAQGILMARHHVNQAQAMHQLVRLSREQAAPLQRVAQDLVDRAPTS